MTKKLFISLLFLIYCFALFSCSDIPSEVTSSSTTTEYFYSNMLFNDNSVQKSIGKVDTFPNFPEQYSYYDYRETAIELDKLLFSFAGNEEAIMPSYNIDDYNTWTPIGFWIDQSRQTPDYNPLTTGYLKRTFGFPTYVADTRVVSSGSEALTTIATVLSGSYIGIDKSHEVHQETVYDFVEMMLTHYDTGSKLVTNGGIQGQSFWYDIFPQILFSRLYDKYDDTEYMQEMVINGANQWVEALEYFKENDLPYYDYVGYNAVLESPTVNGEHIEPPNGGLAFLFYSAYEITQDEKYLNGAIEVLDYFQDYWGNPNYEALTDYTPYVAAALNYRYGTNYDIGKFLDFLFEEDSTYRSGWSVINGDFGDYSVDGLVGQSNDYAFSMNSFHLASVLAPMVKYDSRYSTDIGKYFLNLVNNAKVFFPQNIPLDHQTMSDYLYFDKYGTICYEGFRNNYNSVTGLAMGDATAMFGLPSDLSLYSSAYIGMLGAIVSETNVSGILRLDLNVTDSYGLNDYQYFLYYNPYDVPMEVNYISEESRYDLFDSVSKTLLAKNVSDDIQIIIPANSSLVTVQLPANSQINRVNNDVLVNDQVISKYQTAVNILSLTPMQQLTDSSNINFSYYSSKNDEVINMKVYFNDILLYDGIPITEFNYDKSLLPDTDYTMKVTITTSNGLTDYSTKRVVCN